jgi:thymidine phosphorylase
VLLGAGREKKGDPVDHAAGIVIRAAVGDLVTRGDPVLELHGPDAARVAQARAAVTPAVVIGGPIDQTPLVRAHVDADGRVEQF